MTEPIRPMVRYLCSVCQEPSGFLNDPCMSCVRARALVAISGRGVCRCPARLRRPGPERCGRCLGTCCFTSGLGGANHAATFHS